MTERTYRQLLALLVLILGVWVLSQGIVAHQPLLVIVGLIGLGLVLFGFRFWLDLNPAPATRLNLLAFTTRYLILARTLHLLTAILLIIITLFFALRLSGIFSTGPIPSPETSGLLILLALINLVAAAFIGPKQLAVALLSDSLTYLLFISAFGSKLSTLEEMYLIFFLQLTNLAVLVLPALWYL